MNYTDLKSLKHLLYRTTGQVLHTALVILFLRKSKLYDVAYFDNICTDYEVFFIHYLAKCDY